MEAECAMERVVDITAQIYGHENEATAHEMHGLANIKKGQGKYMEAESLFLAIIKVLFCLFGHYGHYDYHPNFIN